jgi:rod shape-determining protein MreC
MVILSRYTWWVAAMIGLAALLAIAGQVGALGPFQDVFLAVTTPFQRGVSAVARPVAGVLTDAGSISDIRSENRDLRLQNEELQNRVATLEQRATRVEELEAALNVSAQRPDERRLVANIVARDSTPFTDVVSIDRGANDGLRTGMVVLSSKGSLMGSIISVTATRAFVRLITDSRSKVAAQTNETQLDGVVKGTANRGLQFTLEQAEVRINDLIVTSALSGRFPAGIPIGTVTEVGGAGQDISRTVRLEPLVRLSTASTVLVVTTFTPQDVAK